MGFRNGCYAKVWKIEPGRVEGTMNIQIAISHKNKNTNEYVKDFSGFVTCYGNAAEQIRKFKEGDTVKLDEVDVTNRYNTETRITSTYYRCYSLSEPTRDSDRQAPAQGNRTEGNPAEGGSRLPF